MVDFRKLLKEKYPNYIPQSQPPTEKVRGIRTHAHTGEVTDVECEIFIKENNYIQLVGGPTGYESFELTDSNFARLGEGWNACLGTKGSWDSLFIHGKSLVEAVKKLKCIK